MARKDNAKERPRAQDHKPADTVPPATESTPPPAESTAPAQVLPAEPAILIDATLPALGTTPLVLGTYESVTTATTPTVSSESAGGTSLNTMPGQDASLIGATDGSGPALVDDVSGEVVDDPEGYTTVLPNGDVKYEDSEGYLIVGPARLRPEPDFELTVVSVTERTDDGGSVELTLGGPIVKVDPATGETTQLDGTDPGEGEVELTLLTDQVIIRDAATGAPISGGDDGEVELTLAGPVRMWELKDEVQIFGDPNVAKAPSGDGGEATVPEPDTTTDVNGSVTTTTDEDGTVVTTTYDEVGRVYSTETIDPETGVKVTMVYDESGDVVETQMTWPDGETRTWDGEGNETTPPADDTEDTDDTDDVDDPDDTGDTGEGDDEGYTTDDGGVTISAHGTELLNSLNVDRVSQIPLDPAGPDYEEGGGQTVVSSDPVRLGLERPLTKPVGDPIESDAQVLPSELSPTRFDATGPDVVPLDDAPEPIVITPTGGNPIAMDAGFAIAEPHAGASLLAVNSASLEGTPSLHEGLDGPEPDGGFMPPDDLD